MAELPRLSGSAPARQTVRKFSGLDRTARPPAGGVRAGRNLSARALPCLAPRLSRKLERPMDAPTDLIAACGGLGWIDGDGFYFDGARRGTVTAGAHRLAAIGSRIVIFPEKQYYDADDPDGGLHPMEARASGRATFTESTLTLTGASAFRAGDGVTIAGCTSLTENNKTAVVRAVEGDTLTFSEGCFAEGSESAVTLTRSVPDLDFVCEKDNRLWGCFGSTICCSVLGDPCNWNVFEGLAGDGWQVEVGTGGGFTGCAAASSHLLFFKADCVHKVYGVKPSNFQVQLAHIPGVAPGCARSIVNVEETLFWWAETGLMAYAGGAPDCLSLALGGDRYTEVCMGAAGHVLHLSGTRQGAPERLTYDLDRGAWMPEDDTPALAFAWDGQLRALTAEGLWTIDAGEEAVEWTAELAPFEEEDGGAAVVTRLTVLVGAGERPRLRAEVSADGRPFVPVALRPTDGDAPGLTRFLLPALRCRRCVLRLRGRGDVTLHAVTRARLPAGQAD